MLCIHHWPPFNYRLCGFTWMGEDVMAYPDSLNRVHAVLINGLEAVPLKLGEPRGHAMRKKHKQ